MPDDTTSPPCVDDDDAYKQNGGHKKGCAKALGKGWCDDDGAKGDLAREYCPESCNTCGGTVTTAMPDATTSSSCVDDDDAYKQNGGHKKGCAKALGKGWCDDDGAKGDLAREYCLESCNTCGGGDDSDKGSDDSDKGSDDSDKGSDDSDKESSED